MNHNENKWIEQAEPPMKTFRFHFLMFEEALSQCSTDIQAFTLKEAQEKVKASLKNKMPLHEQPVPPEWWDTLVHYKTKSQTEELSVESVEGIEDDELWEEITE